jgi:hypothetical protein
MTRHALTVEADQSVAAAAVVMCEGGVNRVPLIDQKHHVAWPGSSPETTWSQPWPVPMNEPVGAMMPRSTRGWARTELVLRTP